MKGCMYRESKLRIIQGIKNITTIFTVYILFMNVHCK